MSNKYYSFLLNHKRNGKHFFNDCKIAAASPRDAVGFYFSLSSINFWNAKRLNKKCFEYPIQEWVKMTLKRVYVFELVKRTGKTIQQFKLVDEFDITELLSKFPNSY